jgi:hypothetical protein
VQHGEILQLEEDIAGALLSVLRPERTYTSEAQAWGLVFRILQFANLDSLLNGANRVLLTQAFKVRAFTVCNLLTTLGLP